METPPFWMSLLYCITYAEVNKGSYSLSLLINFLSSYFLCSTSLLQVFLEAESVVVAEPEVFVLVSVAADRSPEVA